MKATTKIKRGFDGGWQATFTIGGQTFALEERETKAEAKWFCDQLKAAFKNLTTKQ
jgi:hypothetical protein